ncbi:hypothetical protein D3C87_1187550 [compost metagenome]
MQQHLPQAPALGIRFNAVARTLLGVEGGNQVVAAQKNQQLLQIRTVQRQPRLKIGRLQDLLGFTQRPVT